MYFPPKREREREKIYIFMNHPLILYLISILGTLVNIWSAPIWSAVVGTPNKNLVFGFPILSRGRSRKSYKRYRHLSDTIFISGFSGTYIPDALPVTHALSTYGKKSNIDLHYLKCSSLNNLTIANKIVLRDA